MEFSKVKTEIDWADFEKRFSLAVTQNTLDTHRLSCDGEQVVLTPNARYKFLDKWAERSLVDQLFRFWQTKFLPVLYEVNYSTFQTIARVVCHPKLCADNLRISDVMGELWKRQRALLESHRSQQQSCAEEECSARFAERQEFCRKLERGEEDGLLSTPPQAFLREGPKVSLPCAGGYFIEISAAALEPYKQKLSQDPSITSKQSHEVVSLLAYYAQRQGPRMSVQRRMVTDLALLCRQLGVHELYASLIEALSNKEITELSAKLGCDKLLALSITAIVESEKGNRDCFAELSPEVMNLSLKGARELSKWSHLLQLWLEQHPNVDLPQYDHIVHALAANAKLLAENQALPKRLSWQALEALLQQDSLCIERSELHRVVLTWIDTHEKGPNVDVIDRYLDLQERDYHEFCQLFGPDAPYRMFLSAGRRQAWLQWYQTGKKGEPPVTGVPLSTPPQLDSAAKQEPNPFDAERTTWLSKTFAELEQSSVAQLDERQLLVSAKRIASCWQQADRSKLTDDDYRRLLELSYRAAWIQEAPCEELLDCARSFLEDAGKLALKQARTSWELSNQQRIQDLEARIHQLKHGFSLKEESCLELTLPTGFYDWKTHIASHGNMLLSWDKEAQLRVDERILPPNVARTLKACHREFPRHAVVAVINELTGLALEGASRSPELATLWGRLGVRDQMLAQFQSALKSRLPIETMVAWLQAADGMVILKPFEKAIADNIQRLGSNICKGLSEPQIRRILDKETQLSQAVRWGCVMAAYEANKSAPQASGMPLRLMHRINWKKCPELFYQTFGRGGTLEGLVADDELERWTLYLGGHGQHPPVPSYPKSDDEVDSYPVLDVSSRAAPPLLVPTSDAVAGTWLGNEFVCNISATGNWVDVYSDGQPCYSARCAVVNRDKEIHVYIRGDMGPLLGADGWIHITYNGRTINTFRSPSKRDSGKRVAVFEMARLDDPLLPQVEIRVPLK